MMTFLAQLSPASMPTTGAASTGPFRNLVLAVTCTMTAVTLILVQVLRGWKKWRPVGEFFPNSAIRVAALCAAAGMVLVFFLLRSPSAVPALTWTLLIGAIGSLFSLGIYNVLYARWVFKFMKGQDIGGNLVVEDILGGFLTPASKTQLKDGKITEQRLVDGCNGDLDLVWIRGTRGIVAFFFLLAFTSLVTFASLAGTAMGLFALLFTPAGSIISR
ncbi:MAG TPA: hypothetical protein VFE58_07375 [Tepidisphaeraceae bacterium]|jgi:hypothetical protein|nr:hypothetical protein [Tepidisphaeraceae bacterium]